jgi:hypothetical protein
LLRLLYNGSPSVFVSSVYTEYEWLPWKFDTIPFIFWDDQNNNKLFLEWVEKQLNINEKSDWYKITSKVFNVNFYNFQLEKGNY